MENTQLTLFLKTSPEHSEATGAPTGTSSSRSLRLPPAPAPMCLDLRAESGGLLGPLWDMDGLSLGGYSTRSFGEYPSAAVESRLSSVLEANPHPRYFLSAKACRGILRRAEKRGKPLPPMLARALAEQAKG